MIRTDIAMPGAPCLPMTGVMEFLAARDLSLSYLVLNRFKYAAPAGSTREDYFDPARDAIRRYHLSGNNLRAVQHWREEVDDQLAGAKLADAAALKDNLRAVRAYLARFGGLRLDLVEHAPAFVVIEGVTLALEPDLVAAVGSRMLLVRLAFSRYGATPALIHTAPALLQLYAEACRLPAAGQECLLLDTASGMCRSKSGSYRSFKAQLWSAMRVARDIWYRL